MNIFSSMEKLVKQYGLNFRKSIRCLFELPYFVASARKYSIEADRTDFPFRVREMRPMLCDRKSQAGQVNRVYFFQDLWAAKKIRAKMPRRHVDVGSSLEGFVANLLCFMPVEVVDIRPLDISVPGLSFIQEDATTLSLFQDNSLESVSCLHAAEHFGLGRYGDAIRPEAYADIMRSLARVLKPGGTLYFSVPIGRQRVQFNSQRIFDPKTVLNGFAGLELVSFSAVDDSGTFIEAADLVKHSEGHCGCGMFEFTKTVD